MVALLWVMPFTSSPTGGLGEAAPTEIEISIYYHIRQTFCWLKISPIAHTLYCDKIFAEFNFANYIVLSLQIINCSMLH